MGQGDLEARLFGEGADRADLLLGDAADAADQRDQPFGIGVAVAADVQTEPADFVRLQAVARPRRGGVVVAARRITFAARLALRAFARIGQVFRRGQVLAQQHQQGAGQIVRRALLDQLFDQTRVLVRAFLGEDGGGQQALLVLSADFIGGRGAGPDGLDPGRAQQHLGLAATAVRDQQDRDPLLARAASAARTVQHSRLVDRQFGVDHQAQVGQVQTARGHVGGDADAGAAIAQRLQRLITLALAHLAGQGDRGETALDQRGLQVTHRIPRRAEDQHPRRLEIAQHVDHGALDLVRRDPHGAVFDVVVRLAAVDSVDAHRVLLIALGHDRDVAGDGGREQQGAALFGRLIEDVFQILAEAHVQHFVGFIQHDDASGRQVQRPAIDMVLQTARRADDDVGAVVQGAGFLAGVHAADAGDDLGARLGVQPFQLSRDLQRQFARRGDGQHQRRVRLAEPLVLAQQGRRRRQAEGHRLARSGLGGDQQVRLAMAFQDSGLNRRRFKVALVQQGAVKRGMDRGKGHERPGVQMLVKQM